MHIESPPLIAPTEDLAPEAMINEGGAIQQPRISAEVAARLCQKPHLGQMLAAFGLGLLVGWVISRD